AEKIVLPQVRIAYDFYHWEANILECPFLDPVTQQEVDLYIQYLQSSNFEAEQGWFERWQDYEAIKEAYESENASRNFPDWYDFYNGRTGASVFMLLPDIRGQKEEFYMDLWRKDMHAEVEITKKHNEEIKKLTEATGIKLAEEHDTRPYLSQHKDGWLTWFVTTFEDKETQQRFENYGGERNYSEYDEFIDNNLDLLALSEEPVPMEAWFDWKEALHRTAEKFRVQKIIETLPVVFEQYKMNLELNISFSEKEKEANPMDEYFANAILRGREVNGEPRDFEF
ncbi:MAG TPA: hypothetical protein VI757_03425, partial [Bacteroidia bacterium]|nr:hypothetical protein [Bacteroidia bacterium]